MKGTKAFHICSLSALPPTVGTLPAVALGTCRAGGVGIVDIDNELREPTLSRARAVVESLISSSGKKVFGLRFSAERLRFMESLATDIGLADVPHWYVIARWRPEDALPTSLPQRKTW